jgi:peptidoglycan/LPS O-acetylase OafA/YrhL
VDTPIPIAQFYLVAPFVVLVLFAYLHLSLQRLRLGALVLFALLVLSVVLGVVTYRVATSALRGRPTRVYRDGLVALVLSSPAGRGLRGQAERTSAG